MKYIHMLSAFYLKVKRKKMILISTRPKSKVAKILKSASSNKSVYLFLPIYISLYLKFDLVYEP